MPLSTDFIPLAIFANETLYQQCSEINGFGILNLAHPQIFAAERVKVPCNVVAGKGSQTLDMLKRLKNSENVQPVSSRNN
jgi:hypothetical protein